MPNEHMNRYTISPTNNQEMKIKITIGYTFTLKNVWQN